MRPWAPPAPLSFTLSRSGHAAIWPRAPVALWLVLALALALRLIAIPSAGIEHPDELFQYFEQAHRLVTGEGVVPWEYRYGMRGGLMPLLLAGPAAIDRLLAGIAPPFLVARLLLATIALAPVAAGWLIGARLSPRHGAIAALVMAIWPELVHFAPHALSEPVATAALLLGGALAGERSPRRLFAAGAMIGVGGVLRFHYLPAAALIAWPALTRRAAWPAFAAGIGAALAIGATADWAIGQRPFVWIVENIRQNIGHDRAARYGVDGPLAYVRGIIQLWGPWSGLIAALALIGARARPMLLAAALAVLALHMAIGHKEYRFILLATSLLTLLAALGSATLAERLTAARPQAARAVAIGLPALWGLIALSIVAGGRTAFLSPPAQPELPLLAGLRGDAGACGVALWRSPWSGAGGAAVLQRPIPLLVYEAGAPIEADAARFNRIVAPLDGGAAPRGYRAARCVPGGPGIAPACLYVRAGGCRDGAEAHRINAYLAAHDE